MSRSLVIVIEEPPLRPWIIAETPLEGELARHASFASGDRSVVIGRDEATLDPDLREAVEAWDRGDDSAYGAAQSMVEAAGLVFDEELRAEREGGGSA